MPRWLVVDLCACAIVALLSLKEAGGKDWG